MPFDGSDGFQNHPENRKNGKSGFYESWSGMFLRYGHRPVEELQKLVEEGKSKLPARELIAIRYIIDALEGDKRAGQEIMNREDGLPRQTILGAGDGGEIEIRLIKEIITQPPQIETDKSKD